MLNERTIRAHRKFIVAELKAKSGKKRKDNLFPNMATTSVMLLEKEKAVLDWMLEDEKDPPYDPLYSLNNR